MFDRLRWQLLLSYLAVFTAILGVFAIAVRLVFGYSFRQSLSQELVILAEVAATHAEIQNNRLIVGDEFTDRSLVLPDRKFEWFDAQTHAHDTPLAAEERSHARLLQAIVSPTQAGMDWGYLRSGRRLHCSPDAA